MRALAWFVAILAALFLWALLAMVLVLLTRNLAG